MQETGTLQTGSSATAPLCGDDDCYTLTVSQGSYPTEVSWSITEAANGDESTAASGVGGSSATDLCIGTVAPSLSTRPTTAPSYTRAPTVGIPVTNRAQLVNAIRTNAVIDVEASFTVSPQIDIDGITGLLIRSSVGAVLSGSNGRIFACRNGAEVEFEGLVFENGYTPSWSDATGGFIAACGACMLVGGEGDYGTRVKVVDSEFRGCTTTNTVRTRASDAAPRAAAHGVPR